MPNALAVIENLFVSKGLYLDKYVLCSATNDTPSVRYAVYKKKLHLWNLINYLHVVLILQLWTLRMNDPQKFITERRGTDL